MSLLHEVLDAKIPPWRDKVKSPVSEQADASISDVIVQQAFGGMRSVEALVCDTSNVDAVSGSIMDSYGIREMPFYTVFFGVSRAMGLLSQVLMERALRMPIRRPKSVTTQWICEQVER